MRFADPVVRVATPADAAAIARIQVEAWRAAYAGIIPSRQLAAMSATERAGWHSRRIVEQPPPSVDLVADRDATVVGWAGAGPVRDDDLDPSGTGEIYAIYADPTAWSTGVGAALMTAALDHLGRAGFAAVTLWVLERNDRARAFYERWGFRTDGGRQVLDRGAEVVEVRYRLDDLHGVEPRSPGPDV